MGKEIHSKTKLNIREEAREKTWRDSGQNDQEAVESSIPQLIKHDVDCKNKEQKPL